MSPGNWRDTWVVTPKEVKPFVIRRCRAHVERPCWVLWTYNLNIKSYVFHHAFNSLPETFVAIAKMQAR